jgi:hypothetical protein
MEQGTEELAAMSRGEVLREKSAKWEGWRAKRRKKTAMMSTK